MSSYTDYINSVKTKALIIGTTEKSNEIELKDIYKDANKVLSTGGTDYRKIAGELWKKKMTRDTVRKYFKDNLLYEGYVATMLWGGLGSDGKSFSHLEKAVSGDKKASVLEKLKRVKSLLNEGKIDKAFESMCPNGENKIEGIDVSYFTKLLFFMSDISDPNTIIPLIYDNWGWHIHAALLLSKGRSGEVFDYFIIHANLKKGSPSNTIHPSVILPDSKDRRTRAYMSYIRMMRDQSQELSDELSAGNLEQYLFGKSRKQKDARNDDNPRNVLVDYLKGELGMLFKEANIDMTADDIEDDSPAVAPLSLTINGNHDLILEIKKGARGLANKTLPYCCGLYQKEEKEDITRILGPSLTGELSALLPHSKRGKLYLFNDDVTDYEKAAELFGKVVAILERNGVKCE